MSETSMDKSEAVVVQLTRGEAAAIALGLPIATVFFRTDPDKCQAVVKASREWRQDAWRGEKQWRADAQSAALKVATALAVADR